MAGLGGQRIPIEYNDFVGAPTYGNILDRYANPSYNLKLYMIRDIESEELFADPGDTVVLAQTGVTSATIDNLEIDFLYDTSNTYQQTIKFDITQPGAADFLDQIQLAKGYLGHEKAASTTLYLEIRFQGYTAYADDEDQGGEIDIIAGPFRWKMDLASLNVQIDEKGSVYNMTATVSGSEAYKDTSYTLPRSFATVGKTLTEHIEDLQTKINDWHSNEAQSDVPDEYVFDLSKLVSTDPESGGTNSLNVLANDDMLTSESVEIEDLNRLQSELWKAGTILDRQQQLEDAPVYTGTGAEPIYEQDAIKHREGTSYDRVFATLLSMCPEFYSKVSRREDPLDPESEVKTDQPFVSWFRILAEVEILGYDKNRGIHARRYTYTPVLYKTDRKDVALDSKELDITPEDARTRMEALVANKSLLKAYNYLFTGLNDQILQLDLSYNPGAAILLPPAGGTIGDISLIASNQLSSQVSEETELGLEALVDFVKEPANVLKKDKLGDFFDRLKSFGDNLTDSVLGRLSDVTGLSSSDLQGVLNDTTGQQAQQLIDALSPDQIDALTSAGGGTDGTNTTPPTEDPSTTLTADRQSYVPEFSGFAYSKDILNPNDAESYSSDLVDRLGYLTAGDVNRVKQQVDSSQDIPNKAGAASYKSGSPRNKLFGFLVEQHNANQFLVTVDLTLRGDPWYLSGPISTEPSSEEQINYYKDTNSFWLEIRAPIAYDPDWSDEDSDLNSGYWEYKGISRTFSAVYNIVSSKCTFSNGEFTVDVHGQQTDLSATILPPVPQDEGGEE